MNKEDLSNYLNIKFKNLNVISESDNFRHRDYIKVFCDIHGLYNIRYDHLIKYGCKKCNHIINLDIRRNMFIERSIVKHNNKYDYSNVIYVNNKINVEIICPIHGSFLQTPNNHLSGCGCVFCNYKLCKNDFIDKCNIKHNNKYNYNDIDYLGLSNKITIECKKHGNFIQRAESHLYGNGCPICKESKGESEIRNYLNSKNIYFVQEKKFYEFSKYIEFDFYIPNFNLCIEFDGIQHFKPVDFFGGLDTFMNTVKIDNMKDEYCSYKGIKLIRISYTENIINILDNFFNI